MSRVLVFGTSPLPIENERKTTGPGIRTWQFVKSLLDDKHKIALICLQDRNAYFESKPVRFKKAKNFEYYSLSEDKFRNLHFVKNLARNFNPDCIVSNSAFLVSKIALEVNVFVPMWFDRGDLMAEAQLKSHNDKDDAILKHFFQLEKQVLSLADIFSTVSFPQKCALIGRLGAAGRLSRYSLEYEFVHVIPCGIESNKIKKTNAILRGKAVEHDDFVVLWSGGYNTWADVDTLFKGIESAMRRNNRIKFVSTGGSLDGQDNFTYQRFIGLVNKSKFKKRFIMLGWIANRCLNDIYLESNLGVNIDKNCYETLLGSRHRLLDWMRAGLPFITTAPSEFTQFICNNKLAFPFYAGDEHSLAAMILRLSKSASLLQDYSFRMRRFVTKDCSFDNTTSALCEWVKRPVFAPDKLRRKGKSDKLTIMRKVDSLDAQDFKMSEHNMAKLKAHTANLEFNITNLNGHITNLTQHASNLEQIRAELTTHTSQLNERLVNTEKDRDNLKAHNTNLEVTIANLTKYVSNLKVESERSEIKIRELTECLSKIYNSKAYRAYKIIKKLWRGLQGGS
jgi:glycosyltransferase involved in cell wall biosynthesis